MEKKCRIIESVDKLTERMKRNPPGVFPPNRSAKIWKSSMHILGKGEEPKAEQEKGRIGMPSSVITNGTSTTVANSRFIAYTLD